LRFDYWVNRITDLDNEDVNLFRVYVYGFLAAGAVILLFTLIGIYGAARPDRLGLIIVSQINILIKLCSGSVYKALDTMLWECL